MSVDNEQTEKHKHSEDDSPNQIPPELVLVLGVESLLTGFKPSPV